MDTPPRQVDDIYRMGAGSIDCRGVRNCSSQQLFLQLGAPAGGSLIFTHIPVRQTDRQTQRPRSSCD